VSKSTGTQIAGASSPYAHTGLSNGTAYYYVVTAVNGAGESAESAEVGVTPQVSAPAAPAGVSATAGNGQVTLSWSAVTGATSYNLYFSTSTGVTKTTGTKITGVTSPYTHTGRTNGTTYYYVVTAVNAGGESAESAQVSATPQAPVTSYNLVVNGDNTFGSIHPGSTVYLRVVNIATNTVAGTGTYTQMIAASGFTFNLTGILTSGASYRVDFYVDLGTLGVCVTGVDHYWRYTTGVVSANVTIPSSHNDAQTEVCATFN
jgi:fibronectin type 3 domain-containing protein